MSQPPSSLPGTAPSNSNMPPAQNPVTAGYEKFVKETPLVSRYILTACFICYLASFFINPQFSLANIPYFCVYKLEVYRIVMAPLLCDNLMTLVFAYFIVADQVKRLEFSLGSTAFAILFGVLNLLVNLAHILVCLALRLLTGSPTWMLLPAAGIWIVLLPLIATECLQAPSGSRRKLFCWTIPALYYPLVLGALLAIMSGNHIVYAVATALGYAHGWQYLQVITSKVMNPAKCKQWEETILVDFTTRPGFVPGHAATGSGAWDGAGDGNNSSSGAGGESTSLFSGLSRAVAGGGGGGDGSNNATSGNDGEGMGSAAFPSGSGRQLGSDATGPTRRVVAGVDARTARLKVLEGSSNSNNNKKGGDEAV